MISSMQLEFPSMEQTLFGKVVDWEKREEISPLVDTSLALQLQASSQAKQP